MLRRSLAALALLAVSPAAAQACDDGPVRADVRGADGDERVKVTESADGRPRITVFGADGERLGGFFAFDPAFTGGVSVAAGDLDGDGLDELVVGAGAGGGPNVRVFDGRGRMLADFFAFDPAFRGGVFVGVADLDGDGTDEIVASGPGGSPRGQAFSGAGLVLGDAPRDAADRC